MSITFAGTQIVSNSQGGTYFGEDRFVRGDPDDEIYSRHAPRTAGEAEVDAGILSARHNVFVRYETASESTVVTTLKNFKNNRTYGTLIVDTVSGGTELIKYCRLEKIAWGERRAGVLQGAKVLVFQAVLTFKQVRPTAS